MKKERNIIVEKILKQTFQYLYKNFFIKYTLEKVSYVEWKLNNFVYDQFNIYTMWEIFFIQWIINHDYIGYTLVNYHTIEIGMHKLFNEF